MAINKIYVVSYKTKYEAIRNVPEGMDKKDWEWLVVNKYYTDKLQKISTQNSTNRHNGVRPHRTGSQPHIQLLYEMDEIAEIVNSNPSLPLIDMVERSFGPQKHSNVFTFGGGMKRKHFKYHNAAYIEDLEVNLRQKEEENNILKTRMDSLEVRLALIESENQPVDMPPTFANFEEVT